MPEITSKVIDGKTYNTKTAVKVCTVYSSASLSDFSGFSETLYRTMKGAFFMVGEGGPMTRWALVGEDRSVGWGADLLVLDSDEARAMMEQAGCMPEEFNAVGLSVEEA